MQKKYNFGIMATGKIAKKMADALKVVPNAVPYAVASRSQDSANKFAAENGIEKAFGSYESMLEDPALDAVYIATPHNLHFENTMLCLEHGKHVLCEKPFAVNGIEVRKMIAKAEEKNLFLMEALWSKFMPHIAKAKELIDAGTIGKIKLLTSSFCFKAPYDPESRLFNKELIGGSLLDIGIYPVFMALNMLGEPKQIKAMAGFGKTGIDDSCSITFGYEGGTLAVLHASMHATTGVSSAIEGEKGRIIFDNPWHAPSHFTLMAADGKETPYTFDHGGNGYHYEVQEVIDCLNAGKMQSDIMSWSDSIVLIDLLDSIRKEADIVYPEHD